MSSHMQAMPGMKMDTMVSNQSSIGHEKGDDHMNSECCDAIAPCPIGVDLVATESDNVAFRGDSVRVVSLTSIVQTIYIKTLSPPPKV
jgi:hypothetical protein